MEIFNQIVDRFRDDLFLWQMKRLRLLLTCVCVCGGVIVYCYPLVACFLVKFEVSLQVGSTWCQTVVLFGRFISPLGDEAVVDEEHHWG